MSGLRMDAYYYEFDGTGLDLIDRILSAVACAGKAYHHTDSWTEETDPYEGHKGKSPVEWIQNAAIDVATEVTKLKAENDILKVKLAARETKMNRSELITDDFNRLGASAHTALVSLIEERDSLKAELVKMGDMFEHAKQEAQIHAQEARTANATIAEMYQLCTGSTGEPGNWHGAEPVRQALAKLAALQKQPNQDALDAVRYKYMIDCDYQAGRKYRPGLNEVAYKAKLRAKHDTAIAARGAT